MQIPQDFPHKSCCHLPPPTFVWNPPVETRLTQTISQPPFLRHHASLMQQHRSTFLYHIWPRGAAVNHQPAHKSQALQFDLHFTELQDSTLRRPLIKVTGVTSEPHSLADSLFSIHRRILIIYIQELTGYKKKKLLVECIIRLLLTFVT